MFGANQSICNQIYKSKNDTNNVNIVVTCKLIENVCPINHKSPHKIKNHSILHNWKLHCTKNLFLKDSLFFDTAFEKPIIIHHVTAKQVESDAIIHIIAVAVKLKLLSVGKYLLISKNKLDT
jgi:hypothetical protein